MPITEAKVVKVAAAVIVRKVENTHQILIAKRPDHLHKGGYWEFPGGKIHPDESAIEALSRELREEVSIEVDTQGCKFLFPIPWSYPEKKIELHIFLVRQFAGEPFGCEGQEVRWINSSDITEYRFPEANEAVVRWVAENLV